VNQADRHNIPFLASALTFDALLAAIPLLLLVLVALTHIAQLSPGSSAQDLHRLFQRVVPAWVGPDGEGPFARVEKFLLGFTRARAAISLYALPLFLWFSTRLFASIRTSLTLVYDVPRRPTGQHFLTLYLRGKGRDAAMVLFTLALVVGNAVLSGGLQVLNARGEQLMQALPGLGFFVGTAGQLVTEALAFGFSLSLFYMVYRHASPRRLPRLAALAGSLFAAVLFEIAKRLYGWYLVHLAVVNRFSADANLGAIILFVGWLYYTALVFLLGAVVVETWDLLGRQRAAPGRPVLLARS
jgi:membrane protein